MPVRIYAFAKELGLENSDLLDICTNAGITGKGSALASLDDDEVAKIKEFMSSQGPPATTATEAEAAPAAPIPPKLGATNKLRNLTQRKRGATPPPPEPELEPDTATAAPPAPPVPTAKASPESQQTPAPPPRTGPLMGTRRGPLREIGSKSRRNGGKTDRKDS